MIDINKTKFNITKPENNFQSNVRFSITIFNRKIRDKHKLWFYSDLYLLLSSGLDIKTAFEILEEQAEHSWIRDALKKTKCEIIAGSAISEAIKNNSLGDNYEYYALQIGENTGKTKEVLNEIKLFYERKIKQQRQVKSALTYPILVLITAIGAVSFMLSTIVPMFEEIFQRFQGNLPPLTKSMINLSSWLKGNILPVMLCVILIILTLKRICQNHLIKSMMDQIILRLPLIGRLVYLMQCTRFCHSMSLMTGAHSPLVQSLKLSENMIVFTPLKKAIAKINSSLMLGYPLHAGFESSKFFEKKFIALIKAAEEVNKLEYAFNQLLKQYTEETEYKLGIMGNFLEPLLIIIVGGLVAVILIAMYLPLFQIGTTIY